MNREIANFFWHGELTKYEIACFNSAVDNDFEVNVWSFQQLENLPQGATLKDAREIYPEEDLYKYKQGHPFGLNSEESARYANVVAFSDVFRIKMLKERGGWYFDCDQFMVKNQSDFKKLREGKKFCLSFDFTNLDYVANSCMYFDQELIDILYDKLNAILIVNNNTFETWAEIGPMLVTNTIKEKYGFVGVLPHETFCPINWREMNLFLDPAMKQQAINRIKNTYSISLWNSQLSQKYNLKHGMPHEDSFLYSILNKQ